MKAKFIRTQDKENIIQASLVQSFYIRIDFESEKHIVMGTGVNRESIYFGLYKAKETAQLELVKLLSFISNPEEDAFTMFDFSLDVETPYLPDNLTAEEAQKIIKDYSVKSSGYDTYSDY